jgi:spore cortex formation protein SpoVR/YcgB (stage V sporulation)
MYSAFQQKRASEEILKMQDEAVVAAKRYGLDPFPVIPIECPHTVLLMVASQSGFPQRYPHWRFGMDFEKLSKQHTHGLGRIYELVVNNNPSYAYLLSSNSRSSNRRVISHVQAHSDFFKNNIFFKRTNRNMINRMANHKVRIENYMKELGQDTVEDFIDTCLSLDNLIDTSLMFMGDGEPDPEALAEEDPEISGLSETEFIAHQICKRYGCVVPSHVDENAFDNYLSSYIKNSKEAKELKEKFREEYRERKNDRSFPRKPIKDVLQFLVGHAPLQRWQMDVLSIIREEQYYFVPQAMTKIMNEGWAVFFDTLMMDGHDKTNTYQIENSQDALMRTDETLELAQMTSHVIGDNTRMNPYGLGYVLFQDIEHRWNRGMHGEVYDSCDDIDIIDRWDDYVIFNNLQESSGSDNGSFMENWAKYLSFSRWHAKRKKDPKSAVGYLEAPDLWNRLFDPDSNCPLERTRGVRKTLDRVLDEIEEFEQEYETIKEDKDLWIEPSWHDYHREFPGRIDVGLGRQKIFEVSRTHCDLTFISSFMTFDMAYRNNLFRLREMKGKAMQMPDGSIREITWQDIQKNFYGAKQQLIFQLTNNGNPEIELVDANHDNRGEIMLKHVFRGLPLDRQYAEDTLRNLEEIWKKPVNITTYEEKEGYLKEIILRCEEGEIEDDLSEFPTLTP